MDLRLFPVKQGFFEKEIEAIIEKNYKIAEKPLYLVEPGGIEPPTF